MNEFSPYGVLKDLVKRYRSGEVSEDGWQRSLDVIDAYMARWVEAVEQVPVPDGYRVGVRLRRITVLSLEQIRAAVVDLRRHLPKHPSPREPMALARQAEHRLRRLLKRTERTVRRYENAAA